MLSCQYFYWIDLLLSFLFPQEWFRIYYKRKYWKNELLLPSFTFCGNNALTLTIVSAKFPGLQSKFNDMNRAVCLFCLSECEVVRHRSSVKYILTLIWLGSLGVRFEVGGKITPLSSLELRQKLEIWHVSIQTYLVSEYIPFSIKTLLILLISAFFSQKICIFQQKQYLY